jgi:hypothetical protein
MYGIRDITHIGEKCTRRHLLKKLSLLVCGTFQWENLRIRLKCDILKFFVVALKQAFVLHTSLYIARPRSMKIRVYGRGTKILQKTQTYKIVQGFCSRLQRISFGKWKLDVFFKGREMSVYISPETDPIFFYTRSSPLHTSAKLRTHIREHQRTSLNSQLSLAQFVMIRRLIFHIDSCFHSW